MRIEDKFEDKEAKLLNGYYDRLAYLCKKKHIKREELAVELGLGRSTVIRQPYFPHMLNLIAVAEYFGVSLDWLMFGKE